MPVIFVMGKNCKVSEAEFEQMCRQLEMNGRKEAFLKIRRGTVFCYTKQDSRGKKKVICCIADSFPKNIDSWVTVIVISLKGCAEKILSNLPCRKGNSRTVWLKDLRDLVILKR